MSTRMTHTCEHCRRATELFYCRGTDEYLCEDCIMLRAEEYYRNRQEEDPVANTH